MTKIECQICKCIFNPLTVAPSEDQFLFFRCGHGMCKPCMEKDVEYKTCITCWKPKGEAIQLFVDFSLEDSNTIKHDMSASASGAIVDEVCAITYGTAENSLSLALLEVAKRIEERILPIFLERDRCKADNLYLNSKVMEQKKDTDDGVTFVNTISPLISFLHDEIDEERRCQIALEHECKRLREQYDKSLKEWKRESLMRGTQSKSREYGGVPNVQSGVINVEHDTGVDPTFGPGVEGGRGCRND